MGRLVGKIAVLTGGAGGIGQVIARRYLAEGATLILTGRTAAKLKTTIDELVAENSAYKTKLDFVVMDGSKPESLALGASQIAARHTHVDILINNAGSAGPRQELANIPLTKEDLERLRASGSQDTETLRDAIGSLLGSAWFTTQALLPYFRKGASVINVSTIFSRTEYYGRIAYVVPKAALNTLTRLMAQELGLDARGIRVNTVYPGPVESERIHSVFATMDKLKGVEAGTTGREIVGSMLLQNSPTGSCFLSKEEVANSILFLGTDESTSYTGHDFEVTHGLRAPTDGHTHVISRPNLRVVDLEGRLVWILAGDQLTEACELARRHHEMGADIFLTFRDPAAFADARKLFDNKPGFTVDMLDPLRAEDWQKADTTLYLKHQLPSATIVLPAFGADYFGSKVVEVSAEKIQEFFDREIMGSIAVAQRLDQLFNAADKRLQFHPVVVFFGNSSDGQGNAFAQIKRAAVQQLIRVWRHENQLIAKNGRRLRKIRMNQLVRYENEDSINLDMACEWAISLSNGLRNVQAIDVALAPNMAGSVQSRVALNWERQALRGLHLRKVALITGGSEGIGGEAARLLAISGARVALVARSKEKLEKARQSIIEELKLAGYADPESRVLIIPDCDVADGNALEAMIEQTIARFGRIDYLLNNAGISGAEQMVVDMPVEGWNRTLMANLISNYDLILRALPVMKRQGAGHILNVSSHFGGVRHATVSYPNRSDYAVSKAGQRALAEILAPFLGPDVQINAVAPGPVDGVRLRGTADRPGLYARRAKLILENKRMNLVYGALVTAFRCKDDMVKAMAAVATNSIQGIINNKDAPESLKILAKSLLEASKKESSSSDTHLLTRTLALRLIERLSLGKYLPAHFLKEQFFMAFIDAPECFLPKSQIELDASKIKNDVISTLALQRMPSETDVGREMVFYLANRNVTGETLHPSCGLTLERLSMSGDFVGRAHPDLLSELRDQTVMIFGGSMFDEIVQLTAAYLKHGTKQVIVVTRSENTRKTLETALASFGNRAAVLVHAAADATTIDQALDQAVARFGIPNVVVSLPLGALPSPSRAKAIWEALPTVEQFKTMIDEQLTNHMVLARRASLIDECRIVLVTPSLPQNAPAQTVALANFIRTSLRPLTVTGGQEGGRLIHKPIFNQIDVTSTSGFGMDRFIEAVLLMSLPTKATGDAKASRTSVGTTITV